MELSYSTSVFNEAAANDGSIDNTIAITLTDDTYKSESEVQSSVVVTNLPPGLVKSLTKVSDNLVTLKLTGNATAHANSNDINNLEINLTTGRLPTQPRPMSPIPPGQTLASTSTIPKELCHIQPLYLMKKQPTTETSPVTLISLFPGTSSQRVQLAM